ncbi:Adenosylcobinamide-GDP ribazoletransferase [bioreactor metagenome]|uniref:Adenosylcobinamide-GDP ribazoletransferase n=2 Tax=root TaxID=1 RepID=A0A645D8S4_9ZZZZ
MFMPVIGRLGVIRLTYKTVSPRAKGMGNMFIGKLTTGMFLTAIVYTIVLITLVARFMFLTPFEIIIKVLLSIILVLLFNQIFKGHVYKKIDGVTGDILGCSIELGEVIYLLYIYLIIG